MDLLIYLHISNSQLIIHGRLNVAKVVGVTSNEGFLVSVNRRRRCLDFICTFEIFGNDNSLMYLSSKMSTTSVLQASNIKRDGVNAFWKTGDKLRWMQINGLNYGQRSGAAQVYRVDNFVKRERNGGRTAVGARGEKVNVMYSSEWFICQYNRRHFLPYNRANYSLIATVLLGGRASQDPLKASTRNILQCYWHSEAV